MSSVDVAMESPLNRNEGNNKRMSCPLYGCKRAYSEATALHNHIKDHELPTQSLPDKTMTCSTVGCGGSFPNMQKLMEHMRHHHKPNIYFLCESCHAKLRSYRGLLVHLRTCSKAARPKQNPMPSPSTSASTAATPPVSMDVDTVNPTAPPHDTLNSPPPPELVPIPPLSNQPPVLPPTQNLTPPDLMQHIIDSTVNALFSKNNPQFSQIPSHVVQPGSNTNEGHAQLQRPKTPESSGPLKMMPQTIPSNAWKPGQDYGSNSGNPFVKKISDLSLFCSTPEKRILWQHTRGRYTCALCGHTVTNRREMTEHSAFHSNSVSPKEEPTSPASISTL